MNLKQIIDDLEIHLKKIELEFDEWKRYEPVNGMGKFARKVRMESLSKQIEKSEIEISIKKSLAALKEKLAELKNIQKK